MNRVSISLVFLCVAAAAGAAVAGYKFAPGPNHLLARQLAIQSQLNQINDAQILFLGDSIVERADLRQICSPTTLNAGISGAKVADILNLARSLKLDRIRHVVIAVGINDAKIGARAPIDSVMSDYKRLIELVVSSGPTVTLATVAPTSVSGVNEYDRSYVMLFNAQLKKIAGANKVHVVDLSGLGSDNGLLPESYTLDGVHLSGDGYRSWASTLSTYCS